MDNKKLIEPNKQIHEYVIGIDFGHAETSAAICRIDWDKPAEQLRPAEDIYLDHNPVIVSAICEKEVGNYFVGENVFQSRCLEKAKALNIGFKLKPCNVEGKDEFLMREYMRQVYVEIQNQNRGIIQENNHIVYIATPAGWDNNHRHVYSQMALRAGLPLVDLVVESRSALIAMQRKPNIELSKNIDKGVVVLDMGSSTLDLTYFNNDLEKPEDKGYDCGASEVEKILFEDKVKNNSDYKECIEKYPHLQPWVLYRCRQIKEIYFAKSKVYKSIDFHSMKPDLQNKSIRVDYDSGKLTELLKRKSLDGDISYYDKIKRALHDFKSNTIGKRPIFGVLLTGSASRMDFLKPLVQEVWQLRDDQIYIDREPEVTISRGITECGRALARTIKLKSLLDGEKRKLLKNEAIYSKFVEQASASLAKRIVSYIKDEVNAWHKSSKNLYVDKLRVKIQKRLNAEKNTMNDLLRKVFNAICREEISCIHKQLELIVREYAAEKKTHPFQLGDVSVSFSVEEVPVEEILNKISCIINKITWPMIINVLIVLSPLLQLFSPPKRLSRLRKSKMLDIKPELSKILSEVEKSEEEIRFNVANFLNEETCKAPINNYIQLRLNDFIEGNIRRICLMYEK